PDPRAWRPRRVHAAHDDGSRCGALRPQRSRPILAERQPRGIGEQHGRACFDRESSPNRKPAVHHVWRLSEGPRLARRDRQGVARGVWTCRLAATERQHRSAGYERGSHSVYTATRRAEPQEEGARRCCHVQNARWSRRTVGRATHPLHRLHTEWRRLPRIPPNRASRRLPTRCAACISTRQTMKTLRVALVAALVAGCHFDKLFNSAPGGGHAPPAGSSSTRLAFTAP